MRWNAHNRPDGAAGAATAVVLLFGFLFATPTPVGAHPDLRVAAGVHRLEPGGSLNFPVELHYHRVVGHVRVLDGPGSVALRVVGQGGRTEPLAGPGNALTLNTLIACCKGDSWTDHVIVVENRGASEIAVEVDLVLLHDGIAVTVDDAEPGAAAFPIVLFTLVSGFLGYRLLRGGALEGQARPRMARAAASYAALWVVMGGFGVVGMLLYGGGPLAGTVAVTAKLPWTGNHFVTTSALIMLAGMGFWIHAVTAWSGAARRSGTDRGIGVLGILIGAGAVLGSFVWAVEYGALLVPALVGLAAAALPLGGGVMVLRRATSEDQRVRVLDREGAGVLEG